jgi:hypothetical protein
LASSLNRPSIAIPFAEDLFMDISKIKQLVKSNGDKFIFLEDGEPELVVMSFHEYEKLANGKDYVRSPGFRSRNVPYREEFADLDPQGLRETEIVTVSESETAGNLPIRLEDIRLEDLPI